MTYLVTCCPGREPILQGGMRIWDLHREGQLPTYLKALKLGMANSKGPITIFEDDVEAPDGFPDYIEHYCDWIARTNQVVQWWWNGRMYEPNGDSWHYDDDGNHIPMFIHRKASKFLSLQAVTYARPIVEFLIGWLSVATQTAPKDDLGRQHSGDREIGRALHEQRKDFLIHWPPIVQHVGADSMVAPGISLYDGFRTNPYYSRNNAERIVKYHRHSPVVLYPGEYDES